MTHFEGNSIGEAYIEGLKSIVNGKSSYWYLTIHIKHPILKVSKKTISSLDILDWLDVVNVGDKIYQAFIKFQFSKGDGWTGGKSGKDWINGRIRDLMDPNGYYNKTLTTNNQLDQVEKRLSARDKSGKKMHGGGTNALVCQVFMPDVDLRVACRPCPRVSGVRCLTMIDFKPEGDILNLMAVFRSQYFDTKAYGNFIALSMLLHNMCQKTGYSPGAVISTANKFTFDGNKKPLYNHFKRMGII